jgi:cation/acetate symporter
MKRLGKYTFTDALDSKFNSRGIKLAAAISTLIVSIFYLIPQMVGAGVLVEPLLGIPHSWGVVLVGTIVIMIVATAGMTSTTYVQFIKGALLVVFSSILVVAVLTKGLTTLPDQNGKVPFHELTTLTANMAENKLLPADDSYSFQETIDVHGVLFSRLTKSGVDTWWKQKSSENGTVILQETQWEVVESDGVKWINGAPTSATNKIYLVGNLEKIDGKVGIEANTGPVSPFKFLALLDSPDTQVQRWSSASLTDTQGKKVNIYYALVTPGNKIMRPGLKLKIDEFMTLKGSEAQD